VLQQQIKHLSVAANSSQPNSQSAQLEAQLRSIQQHLETTLCAAVRNEVIMNQHDMAHRLDVRELHLQEAIVKAVSRSLRDDLTILLPNVITQDIKDRVTSRKYAKARLRFWEVWDQLVGKVGELLFNVTKVVFYKPTF